MSLTKTRDQIVILKKFRSGMRPVKGIILSTFFSAITGNLLYEYFQDRNSHELILVLAALITNAYILMRTFAKRYILLCEDRIIIERLIRSDLVLLNHMINGVKIYESRGHHSMDIEMKSGESTYLNLTSFKVGDFYEILEHIETLLAKRYSGEKPKTKEARFEEYNRKGKWLYGMFALNLLSLLIIILPDNQRAILDFTNFMLIGFFVSVGLHFFIWRRLLPNVERLIIKSKQWFYFLFALVLPTYAIANVLLFINTRFDTHPGEVITTKLIKLAPARGEPDENCYKIINPKNDQPISSWMDGHCKDEYKAISEDAKVYGRLKPGFLGGEWIEVVRIE